MKSRCITFILLLFAPLAVKATSVGFFPGLSKLINRADAIVILRVENPLDYPWAPTGYSTHMCYIYQTLKGDIPKHSRIKLQLYDLGRSFATPYAHGSNHLIFLTKKLSENEPTDYRMLTIEGAQTLLSPFGHEKMPEGKTIEEQVKTLIRDAIDYQAEEHLKRRTFLMFMLNELEGLEQPPDGYNIRLSGSDVIPLPREKGSEILEVFRLNAYVDLTLVYQALIDSRTAFRAEAAKYLGTHGDETSIPHLIDALSDESSHGGSNPLPAGMSTTRYWANDSLEKLTGQDFGFVWDDPIDKRHEVIKKWQAWYLKTLKTTN